MTHVGCEGCTKFYSFGEISAIGNSFCQNCDTPFPAEIMKAVGWMDLWHAMKYGKEEKVAVLRHQARLIAGRLRAANEHEGASVIEKWAEKHEFAEMLSQSMINSKNRTTIQEAVAVMTDE